MPQPAPAPVASPVGSAGGWCGRGTPGGSFPSPPLPDTRGSAPGPRHPGRPPDQAAEPQIDATGRGCGKGREPRTGGRGRTPARVWGLGTPVPGLGPRNPGPGPGGWGEAPQRGGAACRCFPLPAPSRYQGLRPWTPRPGGEARPRGAAANRRHGKGQNPDPEAETEPRHTVEPHTDAAARGRRKGQAPRTGGRGRTPARGLGLGTPVPGPGAKPRNAAEPSCRCFPPPAPSRYQGLRPWTPKPDHAAQPQIDAAGRARTPARRPRRSPATRWSRISMLRERGRGPGPEVEARTPVRGLGRSPGCGAWGGAPGAGGWGGAPVVGRGGVGKGLAGAPSGGSRCPGSGVWRSRRRPR